MTESINSNIRSFVLPSLAAVDDAIGCMQAMLDEASDDRLAEIWQTALLALQCFRAAFLSALPEPTEEEMMP